MQMAAGETVCAVKFAPVTSKMFLSATTEESVFLNFPKSQQFSQATDSELREKKWIIQKKKEKKEKKEEEKEENVVALVLQIYSKDQTKRP